jgi:hypothetical protein
MITESQLRLARAVLTDKKYMELIAYLVWEAQRRHNNERTRTS